MFIQILVFSSLVILLQDSNTWIYTEKDFISLKHQGTSILKIAQLTNSLTTW